MWRHTPVCKRKMSKRPHTQYDKSDSEIEDMVNRQIPSTPSKELSEILVQLHMSESLGIASAKTQLRELMLRIVKDIPCMCGDKCPHKVRAIDSAELRKRIEEQFK